MDDEAEEVLADVREVIAGLTVEQRTMVELLAKQLRVLTMTEEGRMALALVAAERAARAAQ